MGLTFRRFVLVWAILYIITILDRSLLLTNHAKYTNSNNSKVHYDDLALKKCKSDTAYSIHGWWPEYSHGSWPQWCVPSRYSEFNEQAIEPIRSALDTYWHNCPEWGGSSYTFWQHEWEKHGTCISNISVVDYFNHTINAFLKAQENDYYGCCTFPDACMIPFAMPINETKWLGYCY